MDIGFKTDISQALKSFKIGKTVVVPVESGISRRASLLIFSAHQFLYPNSAQVLYAFQRIRGMAQVDSATYKHRQRQ